MVSFFGFAFAFAFGSSVVADFSVAGFVISGFFAAAGGFSCCVDAAGFSAGGFFVGLARPVVPVFGFR